MVNVDVVLPSGPPPAAVKGDQPPGGASGDAFAQVAASLQGLTSDQGEAQGGQSDADDTASPGGQASANAAALAGLLNPMLLAVAAPTVSAEPAAATVPVAGPAAASAAAVVPTVADLPAAGSVAATAVPGADTPVVPVPSSAPGPDDPVVVAAETTGPPVATAGSEAPGVAAHAEPAEVAGDAVEPSGDRTSTARSAAAAAPATAQSTSPLSAVPTLPAPQASAAVAASGTANAASNSPVEVPFVDPNVARLVGAARVLGHEGGARTLTLALTPPELGRVHIELVSRDGRVDVHLTADRPQAVDVIRSATSHLRTEFERDGVTLDRVQVGVSSDSAGGRNADRRSDEPEDDALMALAGIGAGPAARTARRAEPSAERVVSTVSTSDRLDVDL